MFFKPLLGLVFNSRKCCHTFVNWYKVVAIYELPLRSRDMRRDRQALHLLATQSVNVAQSKSL